jgi:hypothetical protein
VFVLRHVRDVIRGSAQREEPTGVRQRDRTQPRGPKSSRTRLTSRSPEWDTIDRSFIFSRSSSLMPGSRASICKSVFVILISSARTPPTTDLHRRMAAQRRRLGRADVVLRGVRLRVIAHDRTQTPHGNDRPRGVGVHGSPSCRNAHCGRRGPNPEPELAPAISRHFPPERDRRRLAARPRRRNARTHARASQWSLASAVTQERASLPRFEQASRDGRCSCKVPMPLCREPVCRG